MSRDTIRKRLDAATPGPWFETPESAVYGGIVSDQLPHDDGYGGNLIAESLRAENRPFLAHAPTDLRQLLAVADAAHAVWWDTQHNLAGGKPLDPVLLDQLGLALRELEHGE